MFNSRGNRKALQLLPLGFIIKHVVSTMSILLKIKARNFKFAAFGFGYTKLLYQYDCCWLLTSVQGNTRHEP